MERQMVYASPLKGTITAIAEVIKKGQIILVDHPVIHRDLFLLMSSVTEGLREGDFSTCVIKNDRSLRYLRDSPLDELKTERAQTVTFRGKFTVGDVGVPVLSEQSVHDAYRPALHTGAIDTWTIRLSKANLGLTTTGKKPESDPVGQLLLQKRLCDGSPSELGGNLRSKAR
jgi:hypothetical protein